MWPAAAPVPGEGRAQADRRRRRAAPAYAAGAGEVILEVKDVTRRFGGLVANKDMNFSMKAGEILA